MLFKSLLKSSFLKYEDGTKNAYLNMPADEGFDGAALVSAGQGDFYLVCIIQGGSHGLY